MPLSLMRGYLTNELSWRVVKETYYDVSATLIATSFPGFFLLSEQGCTCRRFSRTLRHVRHTGVPNNKREAKMMPQI